MYSILYVDDDEILLGVNKIILEKTGEYSVDIATSAHDALDRISASNYDLILSDYQMPRMDGIEFLKVVRSRHGNLPFIIFTGKGREEVVMEALNNGVDFYVQKGPDLKGMIAELKHKINRAIERRRTCDELDRSRQQLTDIISFLPDATFVIDTRGRVIAWNHAMELLTGVSKEKILNRGDYEYAIPFIGERKPMLIDTVLHDPPALKDTCPILGNSETMRSSELFSPLINNGKGAHLWVRAGPLCGSDGTVTGAIETIRDMTDIRKIKSDLDHSRGMNESFASILPVGVYETDLSCNLTFANEITYDLFGLKRETAEIPLSVLNHISPTDRDRAHRDILEIMQGTRHSRGNEYLLMRRDGSTFSAIIYGAPVRDPDTQKPCGLRGVIIDQSDRKKEAQALLESQERLHCALMAGDIGIWDVDMRTMCIHDIDEWAFHTLGFQPDAGKVITIATAQRIVHPMDLPGILLAFYQHLKGNRPLFETEFRMPHKDGSWKWIAVRGKVIERNERNEPVRITGTINEITRPAQKS
jgi:PAS domain S-box-containing protein